MPTEKRFLLTEDDGQVTSKKTVIFRDVSAMRVLSNKTAWKIVLLLSQKPMYPAQVAKAMGIYQQSAYYYIRRLASIGALEEAGSTMVKGGTARLYHATSPAFGIEMDWGSTPIQGKFGRRTSGGMRLFDGFINENDIFKGLIVVGAPEPHGPYKSSSRDGHYAVQLAFYLGSLTGTIPEGFLVKLDVDAKAEKLLAASNMISIGGPGTNIITAEFNRHLPIRFDESNYWAGLVEKSGKHYSSDNHGLIARITNPYDSRYRVVVVAGVRSAGTKSAVIALTNYGEEVLRNYSATQDFAVVVQGFDMDSDGKIDHVDVVKTT